MTWLYPTEEGISGSDWIKITDHFVGYQTFTGPGAPALTNEVVQIVTGFKEMSDATKNLYAETEAAKETIDSSDTAFPVDVTKVYDKVQQLQRLCKNGIIAFQNTVTISTGGGGVVVGTTINKNSIE